MRVSFLRHAQTQANLDKVLQGAVDTSINDTGRKQARQAAKLIQTMTFDCVYCSPLLRARQTMEIVLEGKDYPIVIDERLRERSFGEFELRSFYELAEAGFEWEQGIVDDEYTMFSIETMGSARKRIYEFLDELKQKDYHHVLVVSHGAVGLPFQQYFLGKDIHWKEHRLENCQLIDFELKE